MNFKEDVIERERRWALPVGILSVLGVVLVAFSFVYAGNAVPSGDGSAEFLRNVDANRGALVLGNIFRGLGYLLLVAPLVYLFKAALARTDRVKAGLLAAIVAAPILLCVGSVLSAVTTLDAATSFKNDSAAPVEACINKENQANGSTALGAVAPEGTGSTGASGATGASGSSGATGTTGTISDTATTDSSDSKSSKDIATDCANDTASDFQRDAPRQALAAGFGLAGLLGFAITIVYVALWSMRVGLLSRFWGSLGMALGAVSVLFPLFTMLWFVYIGILFVGWIPGGRPPAWAAGEAMPWPPPGSPPDDDDDDVIDGTAVELDPDPDPDPDPPQIERRKRKRRNT